MKQFMLAGVIAIQAIAAPPQLPPGVSSEWTRFQAALKADDMATLTSMIKFPLRCNEFNGDIKTAKSFIQQYKILFPPATKQCFSTSTLHLQKWEGKLHYEAWCDIGDYPVRFIFEWVGNRLLLTTIENVNE